MIQQHDRVEYEYECKEDADTGYFIVKNFETKKDNKCPVTNCTGGATTKYTMYRHFAARHPEADIIIEQDGILPKCNRCNMRTKDIKKHQKTKQCEKGAKRKTNMDLGERQFLANEVDFYVNGKKLKRFTILHIWEESSMMTTTIQFVYNRIYKEREENGID